MEGHRAGSRSISWAREIERLSWAVRVRWAVIGGFLGIAALLRPFGLFPDLTAVVLAGGIGAATNALNQRSIARRRCIAGVTALAVSLDIVLITFVSASSGGLHSPLTIMYSVQVVATAMLVNAPAAAVCAGLSALGLAVLAILGDLGWCEPGLLYGPSLRADAARAARLGAIAWIACLSYGLALLVFVGGFVSARLRRSQRRLARQNRRLSATVASLRKARDELAGTCERLQLAEAQLVHHEKMRALGQLVAGVAHELNNPISFISSNVEHLRTYFARIVVFVEGEDTSRASDRAELAPILADLPILLEDCVDGARRAKRIVADLKTFARADSPAGWEAVDVIAVAERAARILRHQFRQGVLLETCWRAVPAVTGIAGQLEQVLVNLLANAADAVGEAGRVQLESEHDEAAGDVVLRVSDDGPGIPAELLERVFEPFFTTKQVGEGTGIGLSLSYAIVKRHGGQLRVRSVLGQGATFELRLPARADEAAIAGKPPEG